MSCNTCLDAALAELEAVGIRDYQLARGGKHLQLRWTVAGHNMRMLTLPVSPSDWRSPHNTRRDMRKLLRLDGLLDMPQSNGANGAHAPLFTEGWRQQIAALTRKLNRVNIPDELAAERDAIVAALRRLVTTRDSKP
jgi:hypothetical protein